MRPSTVLTLLVLVVSLGCDKKTSPTQPPATSGPPLQTLWPNEDGRSWTYRIIARQWPDSGPRIYQTPDSVPPIPPLSQIAGFLGTQPIGSSVVGDSATFQLRFNGLMTTQSGVTATRLEEILSRPWPTGPMRAQGRSPARGLAAFLRELRIARPDLAPRLARLEASPLAIQDTVLIEDRPTLFLFGYAWRSTSEWIGSYGDVDTALAWKYLTKNLVPGSEFTHRLVPSLTTDVFLHGRILSRQTVHTRDGSFPNAVVCLYSVDYGVSAAVDIGSNIVGYYRLYSYGTVAYADSVGPVASYERRRIGLGKPSLGSSDLNLTLTARSTPGP